MANNKLRILLTGVLAVGFIGGIMFISTLGSASKGTEKKAPETTQVPVVSAQGKELLNQFSAAFEAAAAKVNPSVVPIFSEQVTRVESPFGFPDDPLKQFFGEDFFKRFFGQRPPGNKKRQFTHWDLESSSQMTATFSQIITW